MKDLPEFKSHSREAVIAYVSAMLTNERISSQTQFKALIDYPDGHYRAVFDPAYFALPPDQPQPSKSQWNTLKKKLKRHEPKLFIFKEHGEIEHEGRSFYVDFGYFAH